MKNKYLIPISLSALLLIGAWGVLPEADTESLATHQARPDAPQVTSVGEMSTDRAAHQATRLSSVSVLITGGCGGRGCSTVHASVEMFDPSTGSFRPVAQMTEPRASHAAVTLPDGRVLVSGGWTGRTSTSSAEIFDPATESWAPTGSMSTARASHIAVALPDGQVFVMGGGDGRLGHLMTAEVFDPDTGSFTVVGRSASNHYLATRMADGRILLTGGQDEDGSISAAAEIFDPATQSFQRTGNMRIPRVKHAAALLSDGRVLIIGGSDEDGYSGRFSSTEFFDPETGRFTRGPDLDSGRHKIRDAVATLPSGAVIVGGGADRPEIFDPADQVFVTACGDIGGPMMFATATMLGRGEVLILGGYDERTISSASAWIVDAGE